MAGMALTRLRMDELVNAWVSDRDTPFQIALLGVFDAGPFRQPDGAVDLPRIRDELIARSRRVAGLRRRVVWTRPGEGRPVWADDPSFEPADHVETAHLPRGADLATWAANRIVAPLALDRPLWRALVVGEPAADRFAVIIVVHHVVADGLAGVAMAASLLDEGPDVGSVPVRLPTARALPSHAELRSDRRREVASMLRRLRFPTTDEVRRLRLVVRQIRDTSGDLRTRTAATSLPRRVGRARRLAIVRQPLDDLKRTGHGLGVTVNDLLLGAVTGGLRELLASRGAQLEGLVLRTSVPAGAGRPGQASGMMVVELPVGEPDPLRRLAHIHDRTTAVKRRLNAGGGDVTDVLRMPAPLAWLGVRWLRRFGGTRVNLFVTDVPGPTAPLWLAGARMVEAVPVAPLVQHVGLGIAALSYAGELAVSVNADGSVADLGVLADGMQRSFAAFASAVPPGQ